MEEKDNSWLYNEYQHVGTDYASLAEVEKYEERMSLLRNLDDEFVEMDKALGPYGSGKILEIGCGTGFFSRKLAVKASEITAVDISEQMLDYCRQEADKSGIKNLKTHKGGFLTYEHEFNSLDAVVSQLVLHHLPDFWKMIALKRVNSFLKKNGRFYLRDVVFSIDLDKYDKSLDWVIEDVGKKSGEEMAKSFTRHIRQEYSTYDWIMEEMLYRAGFDIISAEYLDDFIAVYTCEKIEMK